MACGVSSTRVEGDREPSRVLDERRPVVNSNKPGGRPETISGLAGVGDLMLTAFGDLSRNRTCGLRLARGEALDAILASTTVEGVPTARVAREFAHRCNLDLPLFSAVSAIIEGKLKVGDALAMLMSRPLGTEMPLL